MTTMVVKVALLLILATACVASTTRHSKRIINGESAAVGEFPYLVSLVSIYGKPPRTWSGTCSGTLINPTAVLTAAHCGFRPDLLSMKVRSGSLMSHEGGVERNVSSVVRHPMYNDNNLDNDIALWKLDEPLHLNAAGNASAYARLTEGDSEPAEDSTVTAVGWGNTNPDGNYASEPQNKNLRKVGLSVVSREICRDNYTRINQTEQVTENMICAGGDGIKSTCYSDSGGPLLSSAPPFDVVGVFSWMPDRKCNQAGFPSVFTKVANFLSFIEENLDHSG